MKIIYKCLLSNDFIRSKPSECLTNEFQSFPTPTPSSGNCCFSLQIGNNIKIGQIIKTCILHIKAPYFDFCFARIYGRIRPECVEIRFIEFHTHKTDVTRSLLRSVCRKSVRGWLSDTFLPTKDSRKTA